MAQLKANDSHPPGDSRPVIVITGASGNIGSRLVRDLREGFHIVGMARSEIDGLDTVVFDLSDSSSVAAAFDTVAARHGRHLAAVIHLAAYFDFSGEEDPRYDTINVEGTRHILRALQDFDVDVFAYASTMLVHAPTEPGVPIVETSPLGPKWAYPESKAAAERVIEQEHGHVPYILLRLAGVYSDRGAVPTLAHQIRRIYERSLKSRFYAGDPSTGQSFVHIEDVADAFRRTVERREALPPDAALLISEPETMRYDALQNQIGLLIHGEKAWTTISVPKIVAKAGSWAEEKGEPVIPDTIDDGEPPFIRPFMAELAEDHYEIDIQRAREVLDWEPRHRLRDHLPTIIDALKRDPAGFYRENGLMTPRWVDTAEAKGADPERLRAEHERYYRKMHARYVWAPFVNFMLGTWLATSPPLMGYGGVMAVNDVACGLLVMVLSLACLSWRASAARWALAAVGGWIMFAPLVFWTASGAAYTNDFLTGALITGLAVALPPEPGVSRVAARTGPEIPPGWEFNPSTFMQRAPIIALALIGLLISRYLTGYQLEFLDGVWDPFFTGPREPDMNGTEEIITSRVSEAWPVPDAGIGALTYMLEIITGLVGSRARWRTMPWLVMLFGIMIVPLGGVSIFFIVIQPIMLGTWCTLCLVAAAAMLIQIPYSFDELVATGQFLARRKRAGRSLLRVLFFGDTDDGETKGETDDFFQPPVTIAKDMFGGGVTMPWTMVGCVAIGIWLLCTRLTVGTTGTMADADHLLGSLVLTATITAAAESARIVRLANVLFGAALFATPLLFEGATLASTISSFVAGAALIALSIPRGRISVSYGSWDRFII